MSGVYFFLNLCYHVQSDRAKRANIEGSNSMSNKLILKKGVHYKKSFGWSEVPNLGVIEHPYIQSGENICVERVGDEKFQFQIDGMKPFIVQPDTDLSALTIETIEELAEQMYLCGEFSDNFQRYAKFSNTRKYLLKCLEQV